MGVVAVLRDLPIAVVGVVAIAKSRIAAHPVLQQEGPSLHGGIDLKAVSCEVRLLRLDALHGKERAAVHAVDEVAADGAVQLQGVAAAVKVERHAVFVHPQRTVFDDIVLVVHKFPCGILADAQP